LSQPKQLRECCQIFPKSLTDQKRFQSMADMTGSWNYVGGKLQLTGDEIVKLWSP